MYKRQSKKREILKEVADYGIKNLPYILIKWGKKFRIFSGNIEKKLLLEILKKINVDSIGLYFASKENEIRINLDALHIFSKQLTKNILHISDIQAREWFKGNDIILNKEQEKEIRGFTRKFVILKHRGDIIGMGKIKQSNIISNFMPKERRIKE